MSNGKFALYLCGTIILTFFSGLAIFFVTRPFLGEWAAAPALALIALLAPWGGRKLFKAADARHRDSTGG